MAYRNITVSKSAIFTGVATALVIGAYLIKRYNKNRIPTQWKPVAKISKLFIYPLKSGRGLKLDKAECTEFGLKEVEKCNSSVELRDRSFVIYHGQNREFRTGRTHPKILLIELRAYDEDHVIVNAPHMEELRVKIPKENENNVVQVKQHKNEEIHAVDCGDEIGAWISRYLNTDSGLRLGYHNATTQRDITKKYATEMNYYKNLSNDSTGLFSDLTSLHIINLASVDDLNERLEDSPVTFKNFRPTIVVEGADLQAYEEEQWDWIKVGDVVMRNAIECTRCIMTTIDPEVGIRRTDGEPLKTLKGYKMSKGPDNKSPVMGIQLGVYKTGIINVNDTVFVA